MDFDVPYALGKDLINNDENYAILRNGSVVTKDFIYLSDLKEVYDYTSGKPMNMNLYTEEIKSYINELNISDTIINKNAFKYWSFNFVKSH
jgi:ABC-type ATPase with predicted acetyltransferase domain